MRISGRVKFPRDNLIWDTKQNYFLPHLENLICKHVQSVEPEYNELHTALYTGIFVWRTFRYDDWVLTLKLEE
jgi:hypothetical protein